MNQSILSTAWPVVLSVAGFDPSAGAGIVADLKTFAAHNCYGVAAITALTVQNSQGVASVHPVEPIDTEEHPSYPFSRRPREGPQDRDAL